MKYLPLTLLFLMGIIAIVLIYVFALSFEPFKTPTITPAKIPILNPDRKIVQGGVLSTDLNYCISKKVPTTTTRRIEGVQGSNRVYLFTTGVSSPEKGCNRVTVQAPLPEDILPGHYRIVTTSTYIVNPFKTVVATFESEEFEVIPKLKISD